MKTAVVLLVLLVLLSVLYDGASADWSDRWSDLKDKAKENGRKIKKKGKEAIEDGKDKMKDLTKWIGQHFNLAVPATTPASLLILTSLTFVKILN